MNEPRRDTNGKHYIRYLKISVYLLLLLVQTPLYTKDTNQLEQNPEAMQKFAMMSEKKKEILNGTHSVKSNREMHEYVNKLNGI